ncbi:MAG: hypothetical protein ACE5GG_04565 [Candidatus Omnitrophota bacterium]
MVTSCICVLCFSGCAHYKYFSDAKGYGKGFVVSRNGTVIPEYTFGKEKDFPGDVELARARFRRRRRKVEYFYKKMDFLYHPFWTSLSYPYALVGMVFGVMRFPFIIIADYRYEHDAVYRMKVDNLQAQRSRRENQRRLRWRRALGEFIKQDLERELEGGRFDKKADP